jgi:hypothetical protein
LRGSVAIARSPKSGVSFRTRTGSQDRGRIYLLLYLYRHFPISFTTYLAA